MPETKQSRLYLRSAGLGHNNGVPLSNCFLTIQIGITEPRRVAVTTLATRVAEEQNTQLGRRVGYSIRFDECFLRNQTKIKYMTEGILIREMMEDPLLKSYSVIILDEAHERTAQTDIIMGLLKKVLRKNHAKTLFKKAV